MKQRFKVEARRSEGWWALSLPGYQGAFSQGRDEAEIQFMAKDLIHVMLEIPLDDIELDITYLPEEAIAQ